MSSRICQNGHYFEKSSNCPVCPICSSAEMKNKFGEEFPKIGAPAFRALNALGIKKLIDLTQYSEKELLKLHGFGPKALQSLKVALSEEGLSFAENNDS